MTDWAQEGFLDDLEGDARAQRLELLEWLEAEGADLDLLRTAREEGVLPFVAAERVLTGDARRFTLAEIAEQGVDVEFMEKLRRTQGLRGDAEARFAAFEIDIARVVDAYREGLGDEAVLDIGRVLGRGLGQTAQVMRSAVIERVVEPGLTELELAQRFAAAVELAVPNLGKMVELTLRLHLRNMLRTEAADALARITGATPGSREIVVGFADLVGFTALAQQVTDVELAEVVDQFERLAYDVVVAGGGRVVKMIGDEVMFLVDDPVCAAEIALGLADASRDAAELSDVRVGMAVGPVIEREGDAFGATVNLASRATAIAYPGTVVVSPELRELLEERPELSFRAMRPRYLKHIGRVSLSVLRHAEDAPSSIREAIEERRQQMRELVREKLSVRAQGEGPDAEG